MARIPKDTKVAPDTQRRTREPPPIPPHPYRASAVFHGLLAAVIVLVAAVVGARILNAIVVACIYAVVATGWSWFRFSQRIRARDRAASAALTRTETPPADPPR